MNFMIVKKYKHLCITPLDYRRQELPKKIKIFSFPLGSIKRYIRKVKHARKKPQFLHFQYCDISINDHLIIIFFVTKRHLLLYLTCSGA